MFGTAFWGTAVPGTGKVTEKAAADSAGNLYFAAVDTANGEVLIHKVQPNGTIDGAFTTSAIAGATDVTAPVVVGNDVYVGAEGPWGGFGILSNFRIYRFDKDTGIQNGAPLIPETGAFGFWGAEIESLSEDNGTLFATYTRQDGFLLTSKIAAIDPASNTLDSAVFPGQTTAGIYENSNSRYNEGMDVAFDAGGNTWTARESGGNTQLVQKPLIGPANVINIPAGETTEDTHPVVSGNVVVVGT